jgi:hypothetical protein
VGCSIAGCPVAPQVAIAQVVGEDDDDVGGMGLLGESRLDGYASEKEKHEQMEC